VLFRNLTLVLVLVLVLSHHNRLVSCLLLFVRRLVERAVVLLLKGQRAQEELEQRRFQSTTNLFPLLLLKLAGDTFVPLLHSQC
jgi:hypothetical protein